MRARWLGVGVVLAVLAMSATARSQSVEAFDGSPDHDVTMDLVEPVEHLDRFALEVSPFTIFPFARYGGTLEFLAARHHAFFVYFARAQLPDSARTRGFVAAQGYRFYSEADGFRGWFGTLLFEQGDVAFTVKPPEGPREHARSVAVAIEGGYKWSLDGWLVGAGAGLTFQHSTWPQGWGEDLGDATLLHGILPRVVFDVGRAF